MSPQRDTKTRNLIFLIMLISAIAVGMWLAR